MQSKYDIAISFAGEDRTIAEQIAKSLDEEDVKVFFDEFEQANLWGKDLYQYLTDTYSKKSEYCIILISEHYPNKNWTKLELKAAQERDFSQDKEYILPVRIDDTQVPGLRNTIGYLDLNRVGVNGVVNATLQKLGKEVTKTNQHQKTNPSKNNLSGFGNPRMPNFKKEFTDKDKEDFLHEGFETIKSYFKQGLKSIEKNHSEIETSFKEIHALKFTGKVYLNGNQKIKFMIWVNNDQSIAYREGYTSIEDSSTNEIIYVEAGKSKLLFKPMFIGFSGPIWKGDSPFLDQKEVSEFLWERVMYKIEV
ncbi:MAG: TIR domain-containing protein [Balneolaceae bacterium]|nr:TIR domain-containing protein [Balneolaceae bacterium]